MVPSDEAATATRPAKKVYQANYGDATPEEVAAALKKPRPKRKLPIKAATRSAGSRQTADRSAR